MNVAAFQELIKDKGAELYREMPWRADVRPYYILVSELMLQQTQVDRVRSKFEQFIERFPDEKVLAEAPLSEVLKLWQGLGYNRRAQYLHRAARQIVVEGGGLFPTDKEGLLALPGVGKNTAGAILAYAFNQPAIFVETNVRTVYFYHFFEPLDVVEDGAIISLLEKTLDRQNPREFYWALMDYGSWLKANGVKNVGQSKHYVRQSKLEGSVRQVRGLILKNLSDSPLSQVELERAVGVDERFDVALSGLIKDGLVEYKGGVFRLVD